VPQVAHLPFKAGRPFFMVTFSAFLISVFALHFTQYAVSAMMSPLLYDWEFFISTFALPSNVYIGTQKQAHFQHLVLVLENNGNSIHRHARAFQARTRKKIGYFKVNHGKRTLFGACGPGLAH
jgi:hypothetical protein